MARVTTEDCLRYVPNRFALVLLVARRAKQILKGSELTVRMKDNRYIVGVLREVALNNVYFENNIDLGTIEQQIQADLSK